MGEPARAVPAARARALREGVRVPDGTARRAPRTLTPSGAGRPYDSRPECPAVPGPEEGRHGAGAAEAEARHAGRAARLVPPDAAQRAVWLEEGTVALDANVLLDAYQYSPTSRAELLRILRLVQDPLLLPHQAAVEFHRSRIGALADDVELFQKQLGDLAAADKRSGDVLRAVVRQCQATTSKALEDTIAELSAAFARASAAVEQSPAIRPRRPAGAHRRPHPRRARRSARQRRRASAPAPDHAAAVAEAKRRADAKIPPGWKDDAGKGDPESAAGDYILWVQVLDHARLVGRPVVLVTRDVKEDWTRPERGMRAGTHPHLVEEMLGRAGVPVRRHQPADLMREAGQAFGADVSERAFEEMSDLDRRVLRRLDDPTPQDQEDWHSWCSHCSA